MSYLKAGLPRFALHKFDDALSAGYEYSRAHLFRAISLLQLGSFHKVKMHSNEQVILAAIIQL